MSDYFWNKVKKDSSIKKSSLSESYNLVILQKTISDLKLQYTKENYNIISERVGLNKTVADKLIQALPGWRGGGVKDGAIRLMPVDPKNPPELTNDLIKKAAKSAGYELTATHPPKGMGAVSTSSASKSGKFNTYEIEAMGLPVYVVFGKGSNEGMDFEKKANEEMMAMKGEHPILKPLLPLIAPDTIASVSTRSGSARRSFDGNITDVGQIIADTWVTGASGKVYYISLKNPGGATISNHGVAGIFKSWDTEGKLSFNYNASPAVTTLFKELNVDVGVLINNLQQYINASYGKEWKPTTISNVESNGNLNAFKQALMSSIGYGYYYAREKSGGKIQFEDFTTPEKVSEFIGDVQKVIIGYPYIKGTGLREKRKGLDLIGYTSKGWRFIFQFRNASGGLVPRQLNLMIAGNGSPEIESD